MASGPIGHLRGRLAVGGGDDLVVLELQAVQPACQSGCLLLGADTDSRVAERLEHAAPGVMTRHAHEMGCVQVDGSVALDTPFGVGYSYGSGSPPTSTDIWSSEGCGVTPLSSSWRA